MPTHSRAILMLLVTMLIWGSTFVVTKGVNEQVAPFTLAFSRVLIGALILLGAAFLRARAAGQPHPWRGLPWGAIWMMGFVGVALYYGLFNFSLLYTSASQGALVQSCLPAMTALVAVVWLGERATPLRWTGIALSVLGILIVFSGGASRGGSVSLIGNVLMFATTVCWGIYTSLAKRVAPFDPLVVTGSIIATGALLLLPLAVFELVDGGAPQLVASGWLGILFLGAGASGVAYLFYSAALKHVDASEAGIYTNLIPIVGVLLGVMLGEPLSARAIVGGAVVLLGVWLTSSRSRASDDTRVSSSPRKRGPIR